ncbi:hypothetical protein [Thalassoroseus pseudoceratinae]|uniref:hypothetical protein n=1 Tax=Thalassoroseus pseudoceratinae TaxID=2713176 RepID=UPI001421D7AB|nr:hypothetical protein [Thalassoroseus pseudoceratinae]
MSRPRAPVLERIGLPLVASLLLSLWILTRFFPSDQYEVADEHPPVGSGVPRLSLAEGRYHLDLVMEDDGRIRLYTLGADPTQVFAVDQQNLTAHFKADQQNSQETITLNPAPQPGDPPGTTSCFSGTLSSKDMNAAISATIPNLHIRGHRYHAIFELTDHGVKMPGSVSEQEARDLYLSPAGKYTWEDIRRNGHTTASQKYRSFKPKHDPRPKPGDTICPVTQTKANPDCTWVINRDVYQFCCPPCIDEYVRLAKEHPEQLQAPETFIKTN